MNTPIWLLSALAVICNAQSEFSNLNSPNQAAEFVQGGQQLTEAEQRNYQTAGTYNLDVQNDPYGIDYVYHDYETMTKFLRATTAKFPSLTALYSIGKSVQGKSTLSIDYPL